MTGKRPPNVSRVQPGPAREGQLTIANIRGTRLQGCWRISFKTKRRVVGQASPDILINVVSGEA
jgi:hypothetical protein